MEKITVQWANDEKTILLVTYQDEKWTWDDVAESLRLEYAMIESVTGIVDVIVDLRGHRALPNGGSPFKVIQFAGEARPPRHGCVVVVGLRGAIAKLAEFLKRLPDPNPRSIHVVDS